MKLRVISRLSLVIGHWHTRVESWQVKVEC
jgi:hypothetical protein